MKYYLSTLLALSFIGFASAADVAKGTQAQTSFPKPDRIHYDGQCLTLEDKDTFIYSGSFHYFRCPRELWRDRFQKIKEAGFNAVDTDVPWNWHEKEKPASLQDTSKIDLSELVEFYRGLGGISCDPAGPGFKKIIIKPQMPGDLGGASVSYDSPHGRIVSNWKSEGCSLTMDITIPPNTTATIYVPAKDAASVTENGTALDKCEGVKPLQTENRTTVYAAGSGIYRFHSTLPQTTCATSASDSSSR